MTKPEVLHRLREQWVHIKNNFAWERTENIYQFLRWQWGWSEGWSENDRGIPTVEDLKRVADELFDTCIMNVEARLVNNRDYKDGGLPDSFCSTGGLEVSLTSYGELSLEFKAVEKSTLILSLR